MGSGESGVNYRAYIILGSNSSWTSVALREQLNWGFPVRSWQSVSALLSFSGCGVQMWSSLYVLKELAILSNDAGEVELDASSHVGVAIV